MKVIEVIDKCEELLEVHHNREDLLDWWNEKCIFITVIQKS